MDQAPPQQKQMEMNHVDKTVNLFAERDVLDNREWMNTPFTIGEHVYATDAHCIIKVPKELTKGYPDLKLKKTEDSITQQIFKYEPLTLLNISTKEMEEIKSKIPLVDEIAETEIECSECEGSGEVEWEYYSKKKRHMMDSPCPICKGTGYVEEDQPTGNKVPNEWAMIKFKYGQVVYLVRWGLLSKVLSAANTLKVNEVKVVSVKASSQPLIFQVGPTEIGLMPCLPDEAKTIVCTLKLQSN